MKKISAYIFFIALVCQTFSQVFVVSNFLINRDYIAANLCENIDKPELECHGSCFLDKELEKDTERKSDEESSKFEVLVAGSIEEVNVSISKPIRHKKEFFNAISEAELNGIHKSIFHPPC